MMRLDRCKWERYIMGGLKKLFEKYKEVILYVFFGGVTTVVNIIVYMVAANVLTGAGITTATIPTVIAWFISVLVAYITNKIWVFESKSLGFKETLKEAASFFAFRLLSGALDVAFMYFTVDLLGFNDTIMKILSNVVVVILNYIFSKLFIFKKGSDNSRGENQETR